jgi:hypothetical protein
MVRGTLKIEGATIRLDDRIADVLVFLTLFLYTAIMLWPALGGDRPLTGDHPVHFSRIHHLNATLFETGSLHGWSHRWLVGVPTNYHYPFFWDLVVVGFHRGTFALLSLDESYALVFFWGRLFSSGALYVLGTRIFGRPAAALAALMMLLDLGGRPAGGWVSTVQLGVWPSEFSMAFALLALFYLSENLKWRSSRTAALFGMAGGAALLGHPSQAFFLPVAVMLLAGCHGFLSEQQRRDWAHVLRATLPGLVVALLLFMVWFVPFWSVRQYAAVEGRLWASFGEILQLFFQGEFPPRGGRLVGVFGLTGVALTLRSTHPLQKFVGLTVVLWTLAACSTVTGWVLNSPFSSVARHVEFSRFLLFVRPFWFLAGAQAFMWGVGLVLSSKRVGRPVRVFLVPILIAFFVSLGIFQSIRMELRHAKWPGIDWTSRRPHADSLNGLVTWLNEKDARESGFFRVGLLVPNAERNHTYTDLSTRVSMPIYKVGTTPGILFGELGTDEWMPLLQGISLRYLVVVGDAFNNQKQKSSRDEWLWGKTASRWIVAARLGPFVIWEHKDWDPRPFAAGEHTVALELVSFSDSQVVIESRAPPGANEKLVLRWSFFPRWAGTLNGEPISLEPRPHPHNPLLSVFQTDLGSGIYRFTFRRQWPERLGLALGALGILVFLVLFFRPSSRARKSDAAT